MFLVVDDEPLVLAGLDLLEWLSGYDGGAERIIITARPAEIADAELRLAATLIPKPFDAQRLARSRAV